MELLIVHLARPLTASPTHHRRAPPCPLHRSRQGLMDELDSPRSRFLHEDTLSLASSSTEPSNLEGQPLSLSISLAVSLLLFLLISLFPFLCLSPSVSLCHCPLLSVSLSPHPSMYLSLSRAYQRACPPSQSAIINLQGYNVLNPELPGGSGAPFTPESNTGPLSLSRKRR